MAEPFQDHIAQLQSRLEGMAQGQINAWYVERETLLQTEQARFAEIYREVQPIPVDNETVQRTFYEGLEALRERGEDRDYERSPAYADYLREQRETDRAIGRMERREEGVLEAVMTADQYTTWRDGTPDEQQTLRETMQAALTLDAQAQGLHGPLAVLTPEEDTAFYLTVPFAVPSLERAAEPTAAEWAQAEQALDADRLARDRGDIPWVDTIDQLTEAESLAFEHEYGPEAIVLDTSNPQMESRVQALLERLDQLLDDLPHGTDEQQHQREQDQGRGY